MFGRGERRPRQSLISARQAITGTLDRVGRTEISRRAAAATRAQLRTIGSDIRRQREDAGIGLRRLAGAAEVSAAHLSEIEAGDARPSTEVLNRIAIALGADLSVRLFPNTGPPLRDRNQSRMPRNGSCRGLRKSRSKPKPMSPATVSTCLHRPCTNSPGTNSATGSSNWPNRPSTASTRPPPAVPAIRCCTCSKRCCDCYTR